MFLLQPCLLECGSIVVTLHLNHQVIALSEEGGKRRRMVRKIYAVRVEFEQSGSLGKSD